MGKNLCEGAPWCLLTPVAGAHACAMHLELPAEKFFNSQGRLVSVEAADKWMTRYRAFKKRQALQAEKQAASDAVLGKRK